MAHLTRRVSEGHGVGLGARCPSLTRRVGIIVSALLRRWQHLDRRLSGSHSTSDGAAGGFAGKCASRTTVGIANLTRRVSEGHGVGLGARCPSLTHRVGSTLDTDCYRAVAPVAEPRPTLIWLAFRLGWRRRRFRGECASRTAVGIANLTRRVSEGHGVGLGARCPSLTRRVGNIVSALLRQWQRLDRCLSGSHSASDGAGGGFAEVVLKEWADGTAVGHG